MQQLSDHHPICISQFCFYSGLQANQGAFSKSQQCISGQLPLVQGLRTTYIGTIPLKQSRHHLATKMCARTHKKLDIKILLLSANIRSGYLNAFVTAREAKCFVPHNQCNYMKMKER